MVYINMDNVLADFLAQLRNRYGISAAPGERIEDRELLSKLDADFSFWRYMPLTTIAKGALDSCMENKLRYCIVSRASSMTAFSAKMQWIEKTLAETRPPHDSYCCGVCFFKYNLDNTKAGYLKPSAEDLLVDDMPFEIEAWGNKSEWKYLADADSPLTFRDEFPAYLERYKEFLREKGLA